MSNTIDALTDPISCSQIAKLSQPYLGSSLETSPRYKKQFVVSSVEPRNKTVSIYVRSLQRSVPLGEWAIYPSHPQQLAQPQS
jgi:hypothetical protein